MKMPSELRSQTARLNGAKSHGAVTPEGRIACAQANIKHGLFADVVILHGESPQRFKAQRALSHVAIQHRNSRIRGAGRDPFCASSAEDHHDNLLAWYDPVGPIETALVEKLVMCLWRQNRMWVLEVSAWNHEIRKQAQVHYDEDYPTQAALAHRTMTSDYGSFDSLARYETRFDRQFSRNLQRLNEQRALRGAEPMSAEPMRAEPMQAEPMLAPGAGSQPETSEAEPGVEI
jgi:hypothetical protein